MPSGRTHMVVGALAGGVVMAASEGPVTMIVAGAIGALLPDVDHKDSLLGRYFFLSLIFKHRGFTHSLLAWSIVTVLSFAFIDSNWGAGLSVGYFSHLLLDFKIPWLWPTRKKRR